MIKTAQILAYPAMSIAISITLSVTLASLPAHAEPPPPGPLKPAGLGRPAELELAGLPPQFARLALTDAQQDKIFSLLHSQMPLMRDNFKQQRSQQEALAKLLSAAVTNPTAGTSAFDEAKAKQLSSNIGRLQGEALFARISTEARIRALLSPEQLVKLAEAERFHEQQRPLPPGFRPPKADGHGSEFGPGKALPPGQETEQ